MRQSEAIFEVIYEQIKAAALLARRQFVGPVN